MATKTVTTLEMRLQADDQASTKMGRLAAQLQNVSAKYDMQAAAAAKLKAQMDGLDTTTAKGAAQAQKLQLQYDKLQLAMRNTEVSGGRLRETLANGGTAADIQGSKIAGLVGKLTTLGAGYATLQGAQQAVQWAKEGAAIQGVTDSFDKLAQSVGKTGPTLLSEMQAASKGTISNSELMAKANAAVLLGGQDLASKLPQMLQIAGASAKAMGTDVNTAFDSLVTGLARGSVEIIDNLGITVDAAGAYQRYADSIGVSVNELTKAQKTQAFQNEVMTQGMATVERLGDATLTSAEKIAQAETRIKNFTDSLKVMAGEALGDAIDGLTHLQRIMDGDGSGDEQAQAIGLAAQSYKDYAAAIEAGNAASRSAAAENIKSGDVVRGYAGAIQALRGDTQAMSEEQFLAGQALQQYGMTAEQAAATVQGLGGNIVALTAIIDGVRAASDLDAAAKENLISRMVELANTSPEAAAATADLGTAFADETITAEELTAGLVELESQYGLNSYVVDEHSAFIAMNTQLMADNAVVTTEAGQALLDKAYADMEGTQAAADHAAFEEDLAFALQMSAGGSMDAFAASHALSQQYGIEIGAVRTLIDAMNKLNAAKAGQMGQSLGRDIGASLPTVAAKAPGYAPGGAYNRPKSGGGRAGGGGGSGGSGGKASNAKSPAAKAAEKEEKDLKSVQDKIDKAARDHQRKMEDAKQDHADKLQAIDEEYFRKNLEATNAFNEDKFASQLSFQQGLIDLDQDLYDQALAAEDQYWAESQAMAQAGNATQAAEYYAAGVALTDIIAQNAQEMRDLRAEIAAEDDAAEKAKLEQRLARLAETNAQEEQLARDKVEAVKNGGDQIEQERQEAIDKENADYSDAQDSLKQAFGETMDDIENAYSDMGDAAKALADKMVAAAEAAAAAIASIPAPSGGEASGGEGGESGGESQGSYAIGTGDRGLPRTGLYTGHAGEIIPSIGQSNQIRAMGGLSDVLSRSAATAGMGGNSSTSNSTMMSVTMAPGAVVVGGSNATPAQIRDAAAAGAKVAMQEFNTSIGRSALNKRRSG